MPDLRGVVTDTLNTLGFRWSWASRSLLSSDIISADQYFA